MAQLQWNVPSIRGRAYRVGLYHGEESGHLVVYVNNKITLIDFGVTESKDFSFFLEQELFELKITKSGSSYDYVLVHNEEIDSPHNVQRRSQQRYDKLNRWVGGVLFALLLGIMVAVFGRLVWKENQNATAFADGGGVPTVGRVLQKDARWYIQFVADDEVVREPLSVADTIHPLGFPLVDGDEFQLRYYPEDPSVLRVDWMELLAAQLSRYRDRVRVRHSETNPELAPRQAACQLAIVYEKRGLVGWALFFHQQADYNDSLNQAAYLRFVRDPEVEEALQSCL